MIPRVLVLLMMVTTVAFVNEAGVRLDLPNMQHPQEHRIVSGAIGAADLGRLHAAGVKHLVNLRTAEESPGFDEALVAGGLGIHYHHIPIDGPASLTLDNARKLDAALAAAGDELTLVHCGSGNRVGALIAVREALLRGRSLEEAIAEGKRWGLASLEDSVRSLLQESGKAKP
ncbi:MAG TPA: sulfur transferase domain-containing protein [Steroidobacter sp.]|uniref:beta-lactamase hydrolase domain-containing protein n=1 Tax=Steroidobacter sp. TaxID=1978227 RepID=UPI002EDAB0F7